MKRVIVLTFFLSLFLAPGASAQEIDYGAVDHFTKSEAQGRKGARQFPGHADSEDYPFLNRNSDTSFYPRNVGARPDDMDYAGPSYNCNEGGDKKCEQGKTPNYKSTYKQSGDIPANRGFVNIYGSMTGFGEYMNSKAQIDQKFESVGSVAALANITLVMTEPGVAGGLHNAWMQTYADLNNKYLSDLHLMKQFELNPAVGTPAFEAWAACISKQLRGLESDKVISKNTRFGVDVADKGKTWLEAQAICSLDRSAADPSKLNQKKFRFEKAVDGETTKPEAGKATGFRFEHTWDWDGPELGKAQVDAISEDARRYYSIKLSDLLFPREYMTDGNEYPELKKAFREVIGDVTFQFLERADDPDEKREAREGARVMAYNYVRPNKTQEIWFRERFDQVYKAFVEKVVFTFCKDFYGETRGGGTYTETKGQFFVSDTWKNTLPDISAPTYLTKPGTVRLVMDFFSAYWQHKYNQKLKCDALGPNGGYSLQKIRTSEHFSKDPMSPYSDQITRFLVGYVDAITTLQLYGLYINALDIARTMPDTAMDGMVRRAAMQLIQSAAGTDNPKAIYDQTLHRLTHEFLPAYFQSLGAVGGWSTGGNFAGTGAGAEFITGSGPR